MTHPLSKDLSELSDAELADKISKLNKRLMQSYRMANQGLVTQIRMLMDDYTEEQRRRDRAALDKLMKTDDDDKSHGGIIDIN